MPKKSSSNYTENSSSSKSVQSCTSSFTNYYFNNNSNPSSSLSQSNNKLNQGKLIYLDKKFHTNLTNNNNNSQVEIDYSVSSANYNDELVRKNHKSNSQLDSSTRIKRLSCEELENLKERFVDFIKLDSNNTIHSNNFQSSDQQPTSLPIIPSNNFIEQEDTGSSSSYLSSSPQSNNNDESIESANSNKMNENNSNNNMSSVVSSPLPSPTAAIEAINENNRHLESQNNNTIMTNFNKNANRLSVFSSESSSAESSISNNPNNISIIYNNSIGETNRSSLNISSLIRPEPPQRTVSIRNSTCIYSSGLNLNSIINNQPIRHQQQQQQQQEADCLSIRSSVIYSAASNHLGIVKSSRSVFSIYEGSEEDEGSSTTTTTSSAASIQSSNQNNNNPSQIRLERLADFEIKKIESMYRSIGSLVYVSSCTCNFYTTTSEQIANLLNDCWNLDLNSCVPVWIFDTGFNLKRTKRLQLLFVDRYTSFPLIKQAIIIDKFNQLKYPNNNNNDKKLTFTMKNKQLICLIQFYDFFSCQEFYKFYLDLTLNQCFSDLFIENTQKTNDHNFELNAKKSKSMMSLNFSSSNSNVTLRKPSSNVNKSNKRFSEYITNIDINPSNNNNNNKPMMRSSVTTGNLKQLANCSQTNLNSSGSIVITKNCISNPCAFQHINHLTDQDHLKLKVKNILTLNNMRNFNSGGGTGGQISNLMRNDNHNKSKNNNNNNNDKRHDNNDYYNNKK